MSCQLPNEIAAALFGDELNEVDGTIYLYGANVKRCKKLLFFRTGNSVPSAFVKLARDHSQEQLLQKEADALQRFNSAAMPWVPQLRHFGRIGQWTALVTDYIAGYSMFELLRDSAHQQDPKMALVRALNTACERLRTANRIPGGIGMHGDFCLGNIIEHDKGWIVCDWEMWDPKGTLLWDVHLLCVDAAKTWHELSGANHCGVQEVLEVIREPWLANECAKLHHLVIGSSGASKADLAQSFHDFLDYIRAREISLGADSPDTLLWGGISKASEKDPALWARILGIEGDTLVRVFATGRENP